MRELASFRLIFVLGAAAVTIGIGLFHAFTWWETGMFIAGITWSDAYDWAKERDRNYFFKCDQCSLKLKSSEERFLDIYKENHLREHELQKRFQGKRG